MCVAGSDGECVMRRVGGDQRVEKRRDGLVVGIVARVVVVLSDMVETEWEGAEVGREAGRKGERQGGGVRGGGGGGGGTFKVV